MTNTYTWTATVATQRTANNIPATIGSKTLGSIQIVDRVQLTCTSSAGGSFTDEIILPDPLSQDTAIINSSANAAILAAAQQAIGSGGFQRYQALADAAPPG